jgi:histidine decarboxylase
MPCGIVLARRRHVDRVARGVEYVGCMDTTIAGSRNALTPLILWCAIQRWGADGFRRRAAASLAMAGYTVTRLNALGIPAWRHRHSLTVVFPNPGPRVINRWQMAPSGNVAHLITMPHITRDVVDRVTGEIASALSAAARC